MENNVGDMFTTSAEHHAKTVADKMRLLQEENDHLKAVVNDLRQNINDIAMSYEYYISDPDLNPVLFIIADAARDILNKTPEQSLQAIKVGVEEETIDRCVQRLQKLYHIDYDDRNFFIEGVEMIPRKYKK